MIGVITLALIAWILVLMLRKSQNVLRSDLVTAPISRARIITLTVLTAGLYMFYWLYITWKQLRDHQETGSPGQTFFPITWKQLRDHQETGSPGQTFFPVWHALTMLIPVYGLFRLHRHVELIRDMALESEVDTPLNPKLVVLLMVLNGILGLTSSGVQNLPYLFILNVISLALIATSILWTQATLNEYWSKTSEPDVREMPIQLGEKVFALIGVVVWASVISGFSR